jgi:hypothetical protein
MYIARKEEARISNMENTYRNKTMMYSRLKGKTSRMKFEIGFKTKTFSTADHL